MLLWLFARSLTDSRFDLISVSRESAVLLIPLGYIYSITGENTPTYISRTENSFLLIIGETKKPVPD